MAAIPIDVVAVSVAALTWCRLGAWSAPGTFASFAIIVPLERDLFLDALYRLHKLYFQGKLDVGALNFYFALGSFSVERIFEIVEHVFRVRTALTLSELVLKILVPREALSIPATWLLTKTSFPLLVTIHARRIIDPSFVLVAQGGVRRTDVSEALLRLICLIHVGVVLFGQQKVRFFYLVL